MSFNRIEEMKNRLRELEDQARDTELKLSDLNTAWTRYLSVARRLGLPENVEANLRKLEQVRISVMTLYRSMLALQAASGPLGWATAGAGLLLGGFMFADVMTTEVDNG